MLADDHQAWWDAMLKNRVLSVFRIYAPITYVVTRDISNSSFLTENAKVTNRRLPPRSALDLLAYIVQMKMFWGSGDRVIV